MKYNITINKKDDYNHLIKILSDRCETLKDLVLNNTVTSEKRQEVLRNARSVKTNRIKRKIIKAVETLRETSGSPVSKYAVAQLSGVSYPSIVKYSYLLKASEQIELFNNVSENE